MAADRFNRTGAVLWIPLTVGGTFAILPLLKGRSVALRFRFRSTEE